VHDLGLRTASLWAPSGDVAQLAEHLLCKQGVDGSIPFVSTSASGLTIDLKTVRASARTVFVFQSSIALVGLNASTTPTTVEPFTEDVEVPEMSCGLFDEMNQRETK
jgi:hypothetical protein